MRILQTFLRSLILKILEDEHSSKNSKCRSEQRETEYTGSIRLPIKIVQDSWHTQEQKHREKEKEIWDISWKLSFWTSIAASIAAGFAGLAYCEARRQADIAQAALDSSDRPWVTLDSLKLISPLFFNEAGDVSIAIEPFLVNTGKSPAVFVSTHTELTFNTNIEHVLEYQRAYCEKASKINEGGILLPPNRFGSSSGVVEKQVSHSDIQPFGPDHALFPFISGCIRYKYGSHYYFSGFSYVITGLPAGKPGIFKELVLGKTTPVDQLSLTQLPVGFFAE